MKIVIAEDNASSLELLREMLELSHYQTAEARNGEEALARIAEFTPDLVLLDVDMPALDGYGVLRCIRRDPRFYRLPVVALTGHAHQDEQERIAAAGFDGYVIKPVDLSVLLAEMQRLITRDKGNNYAAESADR